jgi:hypothetical protein
MFAIYAGLLIFALNGLLLLGTRRDTQEAIKAATVTRRIVGLIGLNKRMYPLRRKGKR